LVLAVDDEALGLFLHLDLGAELAAKVLGGVGRRPVQAAGNLNHVGNDL
jgi:hypothetical protein